MAADNHHSAAGEVVRHIHGQEEHHLHTHHRSHHLRRTVAGAGQSNYHRGREYLAHHCHRQRAWTLQSRELPTASGPWPPQRNTISDTRRPTWASSPKGGAACPREGCKAALAWRCSWERREAQCSRAVAGSTLLGSRNAGEEDARSCRRGRGAEIGEAGENRIGAAAVAAEEEGSNRAKLGEKVSDEALVESDDRPAG